MSYSLIVRGLTDFKYTPEQLEDMEKVNPEYSHDMILALEMAKRAGLQSAALTVMRAESPYTDDVLVDISVRGSTQSVDFGEMMMSTVTHGPASDTPVAMQDESAQYLREHPCSHEFVNTDFGKSCLLCPICIGTNGLMYLQLDLH